jgi:Rrf2 family protein
MKLSRTVLYAIHAMLRLAESEEGVPIPCSQLARAGNMPERFLLQVLRVLVTQELLHSTRGVEGGYYLARQPSQITLCDILEAFDQTPQIELPKINGAPSQLHDRLAVTLSEASTAARAELKKLTLADLLNGGGDQLSAAEPA